MSETPSDDRFDLSRFLAAQEGVYEVALAELKRGRKTGHWMWFVFPQVSGLGSSATARRYAISSLDEARAYLAHPVLGARLRECAEAVLEHPELSAERMLGGVDAMKLRSSMTLFERAAGGGEAAAPFAAVIEHFYAGERDPATLARI